MECVCPTILRCFGLMIIREIFVDFLRMLNVNEVEAWAEAVVKQTRQCKTTLKISKPGLIF